MTIDEALRKKCVDKFEEMLSDSGEDNTLYKELVIERLKVAGEAKAYSKTIIEQRWKYSNKVLIEVSLEKEIAENKGSEMQCVFCSYWWDGEQKKAFIDVCVRDPLIGAIGNGFVYDIVSSDGDAGLENEELAWIS